MATKTVNNKKHKSSFQKFQDKQIRLTAKRSKGRFTVADVRANTEQNARRQNMALASGFLGGTAITAFGGVARVKTPAGERLIRAPIGRTGNALKLAGAALGIAAVGAGIKQTVDTTKRAKKDKAFVATGTGIFTQVDNVVQQIVGGFVGGVGGVLALRGAGKLRAKSRLFAEGRAKKAADVAKRAANPERRPSRLLPSPKKSGGENFIFRRIRGRLRKIRIK